MFIILFSLTCLGYKHQRYLYLLNLYWKVLITTACVRNKIHFNKFVLPFLLEPMIFQKTLEIIFHINCIDTHDVYILITILVC